MGEEQKPEKAPEKPEKKPAAKSAAGGFEEFKGDRHNGAGQRCKRCGVVVQGGRYLDATLAAHRAHCG